MSIENAKKVFYPNTVTFQAGVKKVSTMADKTLDIVLNTQELPEEQMAAIFKLDHCAVCLAPHGKEILPFEPTDLDVPKDKSPSKRLRAVLYRLWEKHPGGVKDFNSYYLTQMEKLITLIKEKLD